MTKLSAPLGIERDYQKKVRNYIIRINDILREMLIPNLPFLVDQAAALRPKNDRMDDISDDINELFSAINQRVAGEITDLEISRLAEDEASEISQWNRKRITALIKQGLGIDIFISEPWLAQELNLFVTDNVTLIKSNNQLFLDQVKDTVTRGVRQGLRHEAIARQINGTNKTELGVSRFRNAKTRANLIGRDQVNKLNGQLTKLRQEEIGIKKFIWRTANDGRVRDKHENFANNEYTWAEGAGGIYPGEEIQCRCYAEPIIDIDDL